MSWFVGVIWGKGKLDQLPRFLAEGIWQNGRADKHVDKVLSMKVGDRIAAKATYTRKNDLPFDNRGNVVSVMAIRAVGTVTSNHGDGRTVSVDWTELAPRREWFFYTERSTVWRVEPGAGYKDELIDFTFNDASQNIDAFRNTPFWSARFGDDAGDVALPHWEGRVQFYEAVADGLAAFHDDRGHLIAGLHEIAARLTVGMNLTDRFADGSTGPLDDIDPFTVMGLFNRGTTESNRRAIASEIAQLLGIDVPVPDSFLGVPQFNNQSSWLFNFADGRAEGEIDTLWTLFMATLEYLGSDVEDGDVESLEDDVKAAFDAVRELPVGAAQLGKVLHWVRPWDCISLDLKTQAYIRDVVGLDLAKYNVAGDMRAEDYFALGGDLTASFERSDSKVESFPDLVWNALEGDQPEEETQVEIQSAVETSYTVDSIIEEGCFLDRSELVSMIDKLRSKKNIMLQGPPGTGKTWLAKRLAFALMGTKDRTALRAMQFHPNMSYEDFVRGWRPGSDGTLTLVDGPFLELIDDAMASPDVQFVLVIEEVNRGNLAQIFGEMLTLLEADKRSEDEALHLTYRRVDDKPVYIPRNVHLIGTMNVADRSLAIVDLALRRRFAFFGLEPQLNEQWLKWVTTRSGLQKGFALKIKASVEALNSEIAKDRNLGVQYRIGHSFFTPEAVAVRPNQEEWFRQVVRTEIATLLNEYWFDFPEVAEKSSKQLLESL